ncbi:N-acetyl sugar amidotransferase [Vibrio sp. RE86]|uniref:N-acetyl sugar amidotransferase n=1 Tax=Vibrio sp. RE86 TaxID=2607605 RepID=UPI00149360B0|nr:N-acetyl sugar amidotransferase [Vibrio sp. RE86]NOH80813.1 N-acetyl sugar amidotransferase [Vibrio sp. RE86]
MTLFQRCSRCIMDNSVDPSIQFDDSGICNHCLRYDQLLDSRVFKDEDAQEKLKEIVRKISRAGKGKEYDCIVGVSGGVDSTYVAYLTKQLGLRPLAVHFDNGWNSELAVKNVERVLKKLDIDLVTYVVDWEEFKDLQIAFLKASTPDGEIPTDHAIYALLWQEALKHGIKYIISGMNFTTESISVPDWSYGHSDWKFIKSIHKKYGTVKLSTYPHYNFGFLFYVNFIRGIRSVSILNYVDYNKDEVMALLQNELGWVYYGGKHHESIYTRFYQGYVLPKKFGIDKRYGHLSDLINAGQISRSKALDEIKNVPYPVALQKQDKEYVCKKLGISEDKFEDIMRNEVKSFREYPNSYSFVQFLRLLVNKMRSAGLYPK